METATRRKDKRRQEQTQRKRCMDINGRVRDKHKHTFKADIQKQAVREECRMETHSQKTCKKTTHMKSKENK